METGADPVVSAAKDVSRLWWLWLVFGAVWTLIAVTILQFDQASVTTVARGNSSPTVSANDAS